MLSRQSRRLGLSLDSNLRLGLASSRRTGILNHDWHPTRVRLAVPSLAPRPVPLVAALVRRSSALHLVRSFHSTSPRRDILFVSAPLFKQTLLYLVRVSLVSIPFLWRYKVFARFPRQTRWLVWVPLCALSLVVALGLDQSERTSRWRLLLMSDREEVEWSNQRFDELMATESLFLVAPEDPRVRPLKDVCDRLVQALHDQGAVSFSQQARIERIRSNGATARRFVVPSATTEGLRMPYRPETGNPEKVLAKDGWTLYVIDQPVVNAFVLSSRDVFCYTGLLALTEGDEDLLAAVMGHEIEHLQERHIVESLGFMALSGVLFDILRGCSWALTISFPIVGDALSSAFTFVDRKLSHRAYSRKLEIEADWLGMELMARAGYDPRAAIRLWEILNEAEREVERDEAGAGGAGGGESMWWDEWDAHAWLRTHPTGEERLERLRERLPNAVKLYDEAVRSRKVETEMSMRTSLQSTRVLGQGLRSSPVVRQSKQAADPFEFHTNDETPFWSRVRKAIVVNPESSSGNPLPAKFRTPEPASRPEKMSVPSSKASDVAENPYFKRDFRRMYPKTEVVTQGELAKLLIAQGGFESLPPVSSSEASNTTAVTADSPAPSLASLYSSATTQASFKPPTPPGPKFKWAPAKENAPHDPESYFPMYLADTSKL
ncbi:hypothetical protein JCM3766R1_001632 [Sporobolomyces carnicolor]